MKKAKTYFDKLHTWGRIWTITALFVLLCVPLIFSLYYNVWPDAQPMFKALLSVIPLYWGTAVIEVVTYSPMLGTGAYLSFVTGNIANLKLPCALSAMDKAGVKAGTEEGDIIATVSIGVSSIVTTIIIAAGVIILGPAISKITAPDSFFAPAFNQVLPALFGALGAAYFKKYFKISVFPIVVGCIVLLFSPTLPVGTLIVVTLVAAIGGAFAMFKLKLVK